MSKTKGRYSVELYELDDRLINAKKELIERLESKYCEPVFSMYEVYNAGFIYPEGGILIKKHYGRKPFTGNVVSTEEAPLIYRYYIKEGSTVLSELFEYSTRLNRTEIFQLDNFKTFKSEDYFPNGNLRERRSGRTKSGYLHHTGQVSGGYSWFVEKFNSDRKLHTSFKKIYLDDLEIRNDGLYYDPSETEPFTGLSHEDIDKGDGWFQRRSIHLLKGKIMLETFKDTS